MISNIKPRIAGIYKITQRDTGRVYVGMSHTGIPKRWRDHILGLMDGAHDNIGLQSDFNTYGAGSFLFEIVELVSDVSRFDLINKEQNLINSLKKQGVSCYNTVVRYSGEIPKDIQVKKWYTTKELAAIFSTSRATIASMARKRGWQSRPVSGKVNSPMRYFIEDILSEIEARLGVRI